MNKVIITVEQVKGNTSEKISAILAGIDRDTEVLFQEGEYYIKSPIAVEGKSNVVIDGQGCVFTAHFDRKKRWTESTDLFHVNHCDHLTFRNMVIDSSQPVNVAGRIIKCEGNDIDVKLDPSLPLDGDEMFISTMDFDEDMTPSKGFFAEGKHDPSVRTVIAGEIPCTNSENPDIPHEMIGDQLVRIHSYKDITRGITGRKCNISHSYYGLVAFVFRNCDTALIENVKLVNYGGFGFTILPRCHDFTFKNVIFKSKDPVHQPYSLNSDGIHVTGLTGKLTIEDCYFEQLGDDCLNLHTHVMTVKEISSGSILITYDKIGGIIPAEWGKKGDILRVYDPASKDFKGCLTVRDYADGYVYFDRCDVDLKVGDYITNQVFFPTVHVKHCTAKNCRARPILLQSTDYTLIEDCDFYGTGSAIVMNVALNRWLEAGPVKNINIVNNRFHRTSSRPAYNDTAAVLVRVSEDSDHNISNMHGNISVVGNSFENIPYFPVRIYATKGVTVRDNIFTDCNGDKGDIHIFNCSDTDIVNNVSIKDGQKREIKISDIYYEK